MNIKLREKENNPFEDNLVKYLLFNRDIGDVDFIDKYTNANAYDLCDASTLSNIQYVADVFKKHMDKQSEVGILYDSDFDGYSSGGIMYKYIYDKYDITSIMFIHENKYHGLSDDDIYEEIEKSNIDLLIIPDAGSNDSDRCHELMEHGIDVIVLDHHNIEGDNIVEKHVVNPYNHNDKYENKFLSGCGVTYKFISFLEQKELPEFYELVGLSILSDSMNITTLENRFFVNQCLQKQEHPFIKMLVEKASYSLGGKETLTAHDISFNIIPPINAMIRVGDIEEKNEIAKAFSNVCEDSVRTWRGVTTNENTFSKGARLCVNARSKQSRIRKKDLELLKDTIDIYGLDCHNIIVVNGLDNINKNITGLSAMDLVSYYNKPVLVGNSFEKEYFDEQKQEVVKEQYMAGSARTTSDINNFKTILESTEMFTMLAGHEGAFGWEIKFDDVSKMLKKVDKMVLNSTHDEILVDEIIDSDEIDTLYIHEFQEFDNYVANGIDEPIIYVKNVEVGSTDIELIGKTKDTLKITCDDISYMMFKCEESNELYHKCKNIVENKKRETFNMNVVGVPNTNVFNGIESEQIKIKYAIIGDSFDEQDSEDQEGAFDYLEGFEEFL